MSYLKTAYAHGQADALAALGIKQANFLQKARTLFGGAAHAGETPLGHLAAHPPSGVRLTSPQDLIPEHLRQLGDRGLTAAGTARDVSRTGVEAGLARPPALGGSLPATKRNPTLALDEGFLQTVPAFHDLGQQFSRIAPAAPAAGAAPKLVRLSDYL